MRKHKTTLLTVLGLSIVLSLSACGNKTKETNQTEQTEQTNQTEQTEQTEPTDQTDQTEASYTEKSTEQPANDDYPDNNPQHQKAWDNFKENWNESDYGTTTKGKVANDFPYYGPTGYDVTLLEERTTDKGYTVMYDTNTGRVYYSGMITPDGSIYDDIKSDTVLVQYELDNNLNSGYDITYSQMQELLGTYSGN